MAKKTLEINSETLELLNVYSYLSGDNVEISILRAIKNDIGINQCLYGDLLEISIDQHIKNMES